MRGWDESDDVHCVIEESQTDVKINLLIEHGVIASSPRIGNHIPPPRYYTFDSHSNSPKKKERNIAFFKRIFLNLFSD